MGAYSATTHDNDEGRTKFPKTVIGQEDAVPSQLFENKLFKTISIRLLVVDNGVGVHRHRNHPSLPLPQEPYFVHLPCWVQMWLMRLQTLSSTTCQSLGFFVPCTERNELCIFSNTLQNPHRKTYPSNMMVISYFRY